jgi:hypothetical protein
MAWFVPKLPEQFKLLPRWLEQPGVCSLRLSMNEPEHQKMFAEGAFEPVWKACLDQDMAVAVWTRSGPALMEPVLQKYPNPHLHRRPLRLGRPRRGPRGR